MTSRLLYETQCLWKLLNGDVTVDILGTFCTVISCHVLCALLIPCLCTRTQSEHSSITHGMHVL